MRNPDRVNVSIDGKYRFSLDISQIVEFGIKAGRELEDEEIKLLEEESSFGKLYGRGLEYSLSRPHSVRELRDYLYKKTLDNRGKEGKVRKGYSPTLAARVLQTLQRKGYVDDEKFAQWWVDNRNQTKGTSLRKIVSELKSKGVASEVITATLEKGGRNDELEIAKIINRKRHKYADDTKFMQYLARQGFDYDTIKRALSSVD